MIKYIVNEDKKVVVAKFEKDYPDSKDKYTWKKFIVSHIENVLRKGGLRDINLIAYKAIENILNETGSFCGVAKCAPNDTFDVKKGKELAKKRLLKKYYRAQKKVVQYYVNGISRVQKKFVEDLDKTYAKAAILDIEIHNMKK